MSSITDITIEMRNLSLTAPLPKNLLSPAIVDALGANPCIPFQDYLSFASTCFNWSTQRFAPFLGKLDFLNTLFKRIVMKDHHWAVSWMFNSSEKNSFILRLFPKKSYTAPLSISFSGEREIDHNVLRLVFQKFPNVQNFLFRENQKINNDIFEFCVNSCENLVSLTVPNCISGSNYLNIYWPRSIKQLKLSEDVSGNGIKKIFKSCPQIERLYLSPLSWKLGRIFFDNVVFPSSLCLLSLDKTKITNAGLSKIAKTCPKLKALSLYECPYITEVGIVAAGFSSTVKVLFKIYCPPPRYLRYRTDLSYV